MNSYKDSAEWQALNKIWKSLSKDTQTQLSEDFKLISKFIETNIHAEDKSKETKNDDNYKYLSSLSEKCIEFIINNKPNLYHSMMAVLDSYNFSDCKGGDSFQFVRNGFYCVDAKDSTEDKLVFNRIVSLKSSFKLQK